MLLTLSRLRGALPPRSMIIRGFSSVIRQNILVSSTLLLCTQRYGSKNTRRKKRFVEEINFNNTQTSKKTADIFPDMTAEELSKSLGVNFDELKKVLVTMNKRNLELIECTQPLLKEDVLKVVHMFNFKPRRMNRTIQENSNEENDIKPLPPASPQDCVERSPVVTIMGHVDHGKTTLLDALRNSRITEGEFGGITQHIGAFSVELKNTKRRVTFLDTPGHSAFAAMRARGARATDIVVLVVAADDGVQEQTIQSIKFAQEAGVPIVVAVNKCDKPEADPAFAKRSLLEHRIVVEELGGDVQCVEISALHSKNLPALTEALLMQSDMMNLQSTPKGPVEGIVIESSTMHGIGKVCTILVTRGTLKKGGILVGGTSWCKVRTLTDEDGNTVSTAGPSMPVRVSGWKENLPAPGDRISQADSVDAAQKCVDYREEQEMEQKMLKDWETISNRREEERSKYLANRMAMRGRGMRYGSTLRKVVHKQNPILRANEDDSCKLRIVLKTDVEGTLEAILDILNTYTSEKCKLEIVDFGIGPPTDKDIEMAKQTDAILYMFNVQPTSNVRSLAMENGVRLEHYNVIYRLVDSLKSEIVSRLPFSIELKLVGEGHVLKEFMVSDRSRKRQPIAGVLIDWGNFKKSDIFRFLRRGEVVFEGTVESMKRENETVVSAKTNTEVGIALADKSIRFNEDDSVEVYEEVNVKEDLDWFPPGF